MIRVRYFTVEGDTTEAMAEALRVLALGEPMGEPVAAPQAHAAPAVRAAPVAPAATPEEPAGPFLKIRFDEQDRALLEAAARASGQSVVEWAKRLLLVAAAATDTRRAATAAAGGDAPPAQDAPRPRHVEKEREFRTRVNTELNPAPAVDAPVGEHMTIASRIRAAFAKDENFPLPKLAELAYGRSTGETLAKLKLNILYLVNKGELARTGAASYRLIPESERRERDATGAAE